MRRSRTLKKLRPDLLTQDEPVHPEGLSCLLQQLLAYRSFLQSLGLRFLGVSYPPRGGMYGNNT